MGQLTVLSVSDYREALRKLYPRGAFWDQQFSDPTSDLSLLVDAKAEELHRFKTRRAALLEEGFLDSASELLGEWERSVGIDGSGKSIDRRRVDLLAARRGFITKDLLKIVAPEFSVSVVSVNSGLKPAVFGFSKFGQRLHTPAVLAVVSFKVQTSEPALLNYLASLERSLGEPRHPARFGLVKFNARMHRPWAWQLAEQWAIRTNPQIHAAFEASIVERILANQVPVFHYKAAS